MLCGIESHGARATLGGDILYDAEFIRRIFVYHREHAFAAGSERQPGLRIKCVCVYALADRKRGNDLPAICIYHGH